MPYIPLQFQPGIQRKGPAYANEGSWYDCDKVRFRDGLPEIIGGWQELELTGAEIVGVARQLLTWRANDDSVYTAVGTSDGLWVLDGSTSYDITPVYQSYEDATDPLSINSGSSTLTITATGHDSREGARLELSGFDLTAAGISNDELNQTHVITAVSSADSLQVELDETATSSVTDGGGTGDIDLLILPGSQDSVFGNGWGAGAYSEGTYGTASDSAVAGRRARVWSLDTFGEILVGTYRGGTPIKWSPTDDGVTSRGSVIENAPQADLLLVTSPDRHLVLFSVVLPGDTEVNRLGVRWASQETLTDWTPTATNTSGSQLLAKGSEIVAVTGASRQVLIWSDTAVTAMQFTGPPFVFGFTPLEGSVEIVSRNCVIEANGTVMWMGFGSFYVYDGISRVLDCPVKDVVFEDINLQQRDKVFAVLNKAFQEVWWFYPSADALEINRYVLMNYETGAWAYGTLTRTAMEDAGINESSLGVDIDNTFYLHEQGRSADGEPLNAYIESAPVDIEEGDNMMLVKGIVPDVRMLGEDTMEINMAGRRYPHGSQKTYGPYTVDDTTERVRTRMRVRQVVFRYESNTTDLFWQGGKPRLLIQPQGRY